MLLSYGVRLNASDLSTCRAAAIKSLQRWGELEMGGAEARFYNSVKGHMISELGEYGMHYVLGYYLGYENVLRPGSVYEPDLRVFGLGIEVKSFPVGYLAEGKAPMIPAKQLPNLTRRARAILFASIQFEWHGPNQFEREETAVVSLLFWAQPKDFVGLPEITVNRGRGKNQQIYLPEERRRSADVLFERLERRAKK